MSPDGQKIFNAAQNGVDRLMTNDNIAIVVLALVCLFLAVTNIIQYYFGRKSEDEWFRTFDGLKDSINSLIVSITNLSGRIK